MVLPLSRWKGKVCIVTGASSGIGAEIAQQLTHEGVTVIAVARRKDRLEKLSKLVSNSEGKLYPFATDVSKEEDILNLFDWVKQNHGPVSILVNSAGIGRISTLMDGDTKLWKEVLDTNVLGLCIVTREAVKCMRENNTDGHIIHINSLAGHIIPSYTFFNIYPASKYAVTALTETLRQELNSIGSKIKITSISPGLVDTEVFEASAIGSGLPELAKNAKNLVKNPALESKDVAGTVMYALSTPPHVQVHEIMFRAI